MILGIIPARGGSKGLKRKNIQKLCGKPLIEWSIEAAKKSMLLDRFVVSTEDPEIEVIAIDAGAEVIQRPKSLAVDTAICIDVIKHVLESVEAEIIVLISPTSPIRIDNILDQAIERFIKSGADSLATGFNSTYYEWGTVTEQPRQQMKSYFVADGTVFVHKAEVIHGGRWYGKKLEKMIVSPVYNFDIDYQEDLWAIEGIMKNLDLYTNKI